MPSSRFHQSTKCPISKTLIISFCPKNQYSPLRNASACDGPLLEIYKKNLSSDTKLAILRELRKGNLISKSIGRRRKIRRPFHFKEDKRRISPDPESENAFLDHKIFTIGYTPNFHSRKTVDSSILRPET